MSECTEIASSLFLDYKGWLANNRFDNSMDNARIFVKRDYLLAQESMQVIDNVAWSLYAAAQRAENIGKDRQFNLEPYEYAQKYTQKQ